MHIKSTYKGDLRTKATHLKSGNNIITDAPTDNQGKGEAFSPTDLVAASLASCMMTIMGIEARKMGFDIDGMASETTKIMKADPRTISVVKVYFTWSECDLDKTTLDHLKQKALTCPVALSLHPDIRQEIDFDF